MSFQELNRTLNDGGWRVGCRVYHDANQSINNATPTTLAFNSERYDPYGMHDTASNNSRITVPIKGIYLIGTTVSFASMTGIVQCQIQHGGATLIAINKLYISASVPHCNVNTVYEMGAGEYVEVIVVQSSGGALNCTTNANWSPEFWVQRIR